MLRPMPEYVVNTSEFDNMTRIVSANCILNTIPIRVQGLASTLARQWLPDGTALSFVATLVRRFRRSGTQGALDPVTAPA
jgi:hypothetical protein